MLLANKPRINEVLDGSPGGFLRDAEILGYPLDAGPSLTHHITAVIQINVDELCPVGKLVISVQFFKVRQSDHLLCAVVRTGERRLGECSCSSASKSCCCGCAWGNTRSIAAKIVSLLA